MKNYLKKSLIIFLLFCGLSNFANAKDDKVKNFSIKIENNKFIPSVINAPANQKITLTISNKGSQDEQFKSEDLEKSKLIRKADRIIKAKKSSKVTIKPMKSGVYNFYSKKNPKITIGKIIVK